MELLNNPICKFEILNRSHLLFNEDNTPKNVNVLSSTFFKSINYRKNFGIYVKGLQRTIDVINEYNKEVDDLKNKSDTTDTSTINQSHSKHLQTMEPFYFMLFIDSNIRDDTGIMDIINSSEYVVPVLFKCSSYTTIDPQTKAEYHVDLFGTLVRFFPMFNFKNNPAKIVQCIDIDLNREDTRKVRALMSHTPEGVIASGEIHRLIYNGELPYIYAGTLMFNSAKLDSNIIIKFIESAHSIVGTGHYGKRKTTFGYGIDEMFLNSHLIPLMPNYSIIIEYQISYFLYHSESYIKKQKRSSDVLKLIMYDLYDPNMSIDTMLNIISNSQFIQDLTREIRRQTRAESLNQELSTESIESIDEVDKSIDQNSTPHKILKKLLGDLYDPNMSIESMLTLVDQKTYNIREKNEVNNALAERFYYVLHDLIKNNKTWLEKNVMDIIDKYLRNIISSVVLFKIDPKSLDIVDISTFDTVYTDNVL